MEKNQVVLVIPSLEPDEKFISLLNAVRAHPGGAGVAIVVVNDGSGPEYAPIFLQAQQQYGCTVLTHAINLGKGRALKTAFNHCLYTYANLLGVVTADADGQHAVGDIFACAAALRQQPTSLILGCRNFDEGDVPARNSFGNKLTRRVFSFLCGVQVSDTQTGLRGINAEFMRTLMHLKGERFEFEMNMLIECGERKISIYEQPIRTIYLEDNRTSHFHPLRDSARVYAVFFKFIASSLSSFVIDIGLFSLFVLLFSTTVPFYILLATALARVASSLYNFFINKTVVFKAEGTAFVAVKYYVLVLVQMLLSGFLVAFFYSVLPANESLLKIAVDTVLFVISFQIQRRWVFAKTAK